jgi:hypothetical protein
VGMPWPQFWGQMLQVSRSGVMDGLFYEGHDARGSFFWADLLEYYKDKNVTGTLVVPNAADPGLVITCKGQRAGIWLESPTRWRLYSYPSAFANAAAGDFGIFSDANYGWNVLLLHTNGDAQVFRNFTAAGVISGNGSGLTSLNPANLAGTIPEARLSTNVALLNADQFFTGSHSFAQKVGIGTRTPAYPLHMGSGAYCSAAGVWTSVSDRNAKEHFTAIDPRAVLAKLAALPITQWHYKAETNGAKHLGPTAQDFHTAFGLGDSETAIGTVDESGVALAAIQGLNQIVNEHRAELRARDAEIQALKERVSRFEALEARLSALERREAPAANAP